MKIVIVWSVIFVIFNALYAAETCSRIAQINYQEILIDTNSTQKGEGLRYYLEKDPKANNYLDLYQDGTRISLVNTVIGTVASSLIIGGVLYNRSNASRKALLIGGSSIMVLNFLVAKTLEHRNEVNLERAIDEYNKRNLPQIKYFQGGQPRNENRNTGISVNLIKDF